MSDSSEDVGFVIDEVPRQGVPEYTWCLVDERGEVVARAGEARPTRKGAQIDIAKVIQLAREHEVPTQ